MMRDRFAAVLFGLPGTYKIGEIVLLIGFVGGIASACGETGSATDVPDSAGNGGADTDSGADPQCDGAFLVNASVSPVIPTVGIVEWSSTLDSISEASIAFGMDTNYEYTAPVDLKSENFRTLLLGLKPSHTVHYRIAAKAGPVTCLSPDYTLKTGAPPTGILITVDTKDASALAGGFILSSSILSQTAFVLDKDGDLVWWYEFLGGMGDRSGLSRVKMSADGKSMWAGNPSPGEDASDWGRLFRISMDGLGEQETLDVSAHHDFTVLPDNSVVYLHRTENDGDQIIERSPAGETKIVYTLGNDFEGSGFDWSHCNAIHYVPSQEAYTVSCYQLNNILMVDRQGILLWAIEGDGDEGDFSGVSWEGGQHGHQLLDNGNLLFFNNGTFDFGSSGSSALELALDTNTGRATKVWQYDESGGSGNFGDVQRTTNGNTMVTYSISGEIREVTPDGRVVRSIFTDTLGYSEWRETLYGPPNRW